REIDEALGELFLGHLGEEAAELVLLEVTVEPVGAEEEAIAGEDVEVEDVRIDVAIHADGARDGVLVLDLVDLIAAQLAATEQLVDDAVVLGELMDGALPVEVDAGVADVGDEAAVPDDEQRVE